MENKDLHVLLCLSRLGIGGIQTFVLLHAHFLKSQGIKVSIYSHYPELSHRCDFPILDKDIPIYSVLTNRFFIKVINVIRNQIKKYVSNKLDLKEYLSRKYLALIVKKKRINVIHSNIHITDELGIEIKRKYNIPLLISSHGSYNGKLDSNLQELMMDISIHSDAFVYTSLKNIENFELGSIPLKRKEFIPNGYIRSKGEIKQTSKKDKIIFGIMSRGVEEKGWRELKSAIELLKDELKIEVRIIADGELPQSLFNNTKNVDFIGETLKYEEILSTCDVCLLPSFLREESMPFSVITYLALGKPIIASNIGEIKWMMTHKDELAGDLIELNSMTLRVDPSQLALLMKKYIDNPDLISSKAEVAKRAFNKFEISTTGQKYIELYKSILKENE